MEVHLPMQPQVNFASGVWHVLMEANNLQWTQGLKSNDRRKLIFTVKLNEV
jgi:hypothetical protein